MSRDFERTVAVHRDREPGTWIIALRGEHASPEADLLESATCHVWERAEHVIVDLTETSFLDSSVINWLLRAHLSGAGTYAVSVVVGPRESFVGRVFTTMGLRTILSTYLTRQEVSADPRAATPAEAETEAPATTTPARTGWVEQAMGRWTLRSQEEHDPSSLGERRRLT